MIYYTNSIENKASILDNTSSLQCSAKCIVPIMSLGVAITFKLIAQQNHI